MRQMSDFSNQPPARTPGRPPDHVTTYGSAFWWAEMTYMSPNGLICNITIDETDGRFRQRHANGDLGAFFNDKVKQEYDKWWYDTFESKFLGLEDEHSKTE